MRNDEFNFHTVDEYAIMSAETLMREYDHLVDVRSRLIHSHQDTQRVEDEICYVQREFDIRKLRAEAHALWLEQNPDSCQEY